MSSLRSQAVVRILERLHRTHLAAAELGLAWCCCAGRFARDNCPAYLIKENFTALKNGLIDNLTITTGTFMEALTARTYTKARACIPAALRCHNCFAGLNKGSMGAACIPVSQATITNAAALPSESFRRTQSFLGGWQRAI